MGLMGGLWGGLSASHTTFEATLIEQKRKDGLGEEPSEGERVGKRQNRQRGAPAEAGGGREETFLISR